MNTTLGHRALTAGLLALALFFAAVFLLPGIASDAYAGTSVSRYTGTTYSHSNVFDNTLILDGVDVSYVQKNSVDWKEAKADGIDFAIIRVGGRGYASAGKLYCDDFQDNIRRAKDAGVLVGVYFFSQALDELEAYAEANYTLKLLDGISLDLPVYMDYEFAGGSSGRLTKAKLSKSKMTANVVKFCETIEKGGYQPGLYANVTFLNNTVNGKQISQRWPVWVAQYNTYNQYGYTYDMWQYTSSGRIDGYSGRVDTNFLYLDKNPAATGTASLAESTVTLTGDTSFVFSEGSVHKPAVQVSQYGLTLTEGVDYDVRYLKNVEAGTGYVLVRGKGSYTDYKLVPFTISPENRPADVTVDRISNKYYTGQPRRPKSITVRDADGNVLIEGIDYTYTVKDYTEVGTATVTIQFMGNYSGTMTTTYKIIPTAQTLQFTSDSYLLAVEGKNTIDLKAELQHTGDGALSWSSSDSSVAKVSSSGKVTAVGEGTAVITVKAAATTRYKAATQQVTINVTQPHQTILTERDDYTVKPLTGAFFIGAKTDTGTPVTYSSNDKNVAQVRNDGRVTVMGPGTAEITIKAPVSGVYQAAEKRITITVTEMDDETYTREFNRIKKGVENTKVVSLKASPAKNKVKLTWKKTSSGYAVDEYQIWRSQKKSSGYTKLFTTVSGSNKYYTNTKGIRAGQTWWYKVRGVRRLDGKLVYTDFVKIQVKTPAK